MAWWVSKDEFVQQLSHNYVAYYDNVRNTQKWLADEACKAATGIGQTKRKLYTIDEDIVYEYKRCIGFSGINICLTEPDFEVTNPQSALAQINSTKHD